MHEDAHLEMAYEDANGGNVDTGYDLYEDHFCEDDYEEGVCTLCGAYMGPECLDALGTGY